MTLARAPLLVESGPWNAPLPAVHLPGSPLGQDALEPHRTGLESSDTIYSLNLSLFFCSVGIFVPASMVAVRME